MGFFKRVGKMFGLGKKEEIPQYEGAEPITSLRDIHEGKLYSDTLRNRVAGRGVGFRPNFVSRMTSPYAKARREGLTRYEIPQISAQASARGLGRSTIPINRMALSAQEAERDIEQRVAQMALKDEVQRRAEINEAVRSLFPYTQAEEGTRGRRAQWEHSLWADNLARQEAQDAQRQQGLGRLLSLGSEFVGGMLNPAKKISSMISSVGTNDLANLRRELVNV